MKHFAIFNTHTAGSVHHETINGRDHLVTKMVSLVGNTVMNNILYPAEEVQNAMGQLDMLPAPAGHPQINGTNVSAFHPMAMNAHNIGGFIRNPRLDGHAVVNDFCVDVEVATRTPDGQELMRRMNANEAVGVSTGLMLEVTNQSGTAEDGMTYNRVGSDFRFDHVAVLLNEAAAGEHVGTALCYNSNGVDHELIVNELDTNSLEMRIDDLLRAELTSPQTQSSWSVSIFTDSKTFVYRFSDGSGTTKFFRRGYSIGANDTVSLMDNPVEVIRKTEFVDVINGTDSATGSLGGNAANPENSNNAANTENKTMADEKKKAENKGDGGQAVANGAQGDDPVVTNNAPDLKEAIKAINAAGLSVQTPDEKAGVDRLLTNEKVRIDGLRADLVTNGLKKETVDAFDDATVISLANELLSEKTTNNALRAGGEAQTNKTKFATNLGQCRKFKEVEAN